MNGSTQTQRGHVKFEIISNQKTCRIDNAKFSTEKNPEFIILTVQSKRENGGWDSFMPWGLLKPGL